jgi:hypothetical protein
METLTYACSGCPESIRSYAVGTANAKCLPRSIAVECPLCGEKRPYPPSEVFLGKATNWYLWFV